MIEIKADFERAERMLTDLGRRQLPFAAALALNDTAAEVKDEEERGLEGVFDSPTPFTKRGVYVQRASKSRLQAEVGMKSIQAGYLELQVTGGMRRPAGGALVIPVGQRVNKYGNLPRGTVAKLARKPGHFVAGKSRRGTKHLPAGIYKRGRGRSKGLKLLVAFEKGARYQPRFRFQEPAIEIARRSFEGHLVARLKQAIRTAK